MRFRGPYHLFNSSGHWIGFCVGHNLFHPDGIWCGWFPWEGSYDAVKPDGTYLGTVVGVRFYSLQQKHSVCIRKLLVYPAIPPLPKRPAPIAPRDLFLGAQDVTLTLETVPALSPSRSNRFPQAVLH